MIKETHPPKAMIEKKILIVRQSIILTQKEAQMKLYSFLVICCVLCFSSLQTIPTAYAQDQTGAGGPDKIKAVLLRPAGWNADFGHGLAEFIYEARGEKVVVKIQGLSRTDGKSNLSCERDVTITSDGIKHSGCRDSGISLLFDPKDQDYPFKGKSQLGYEYKLKAR